MKGCGRVRPWLQPHTGIQRRPHRRVPRCRNAAHRASGGRGDGLARSTFECAPACVRDHYAGEPDLPPALPHGLAVRRCEPVVDQVGQHIDAEPMAEQRRPRAATRPCGDKYFEPSALFCAEVTFSRRHGDRVRHRRNRGKAPTIRAGQVDVCRVGSGSEIPNVSESSADDCRVANTGLKNRPERAISLSDASRSRPTTKPRGCFVTAAD
jgi:hypothetical protein